MKIKQLITVLVSTSFLFGCANIRQPFEIKKTVISEEKIAENNGKLIQISVSDNEKITFLDMYYNDKKVPVKMINNNNFSAFFKEDVIQEETINIHINPAEEFGNSVREIKVKPPITINEDQALISYKKRKKIKYKIINLSSE